MVHHGVPCVLVVTQYNLSEVTQPVRVGGSAVAHSLCYHLISHPSLHWPAVATSNFQGYCL